MVDTNIGDQIISNLGEEEKKKPTPDRPDEGNKPETTPLIESTNAATERREAANKVTEDLLIRQERLISDKMMGGQAESGAAAEVKTKADEAAKYFEGTQLEIDIKKANAKT